MTDACAVCLGAGPDVDRYHGACLQALFETDAPPRVDVELAKLHTLALRMVGNQSLSGVQRKLALTMSADRLTLMVGLGRSEYILKPPSESLPWVPEDEHLTMCLAALCGLRVAPCGLVWLADGASGYITRRFDRPSSGGKLRVEDFCQLAELPSRSRYQGSAELCAGLVRRFSSDPATEMRELFRRLLFFSWTGCGDMHLKNLSLVADSTGKVGLAPAYDLVSTAVLGIQRNLALPVSGDSGNSRGDRPNVPRASAWQRLSQYCGLSDGDRREAVNDILSVRDEAEAMVARSFLPAKLQDCYLAVLRERSQALAEIGLPAS